MNKAVEYIDYSDMLKWLDATDADGNPIPFEAHVRSADINRGTGGKKKHYPCAIKCMKGKGKKTATPSAEPKIRRNPHNFDNDTVQIELQPSKQVKSIHTRLITKFNNKEVIW